MFRFIFVTSAIVACAHAATVSDPKDGQAEILQNESEMYEHGAYKFAYATSNNIAAQESGVGGVNANGVYSYTSPEGELIKVQYIADENGFQPQGEHLPTPHPIPQAILESLEYIRTHPHPEYYAPEEVAASNQANQKVQAPAKQSRTQSKAEKKGDSTGKKGKSV